MLLIGNFLILLAILALVASTAFYYSRGMELVHAYVAILENPLGAIAFAAILYAGAVVPVADPTSDRQAKLRRLSNRSLAMVFLLCIILIPALQHLSTMSVFLALSVVAILTAFASSALLLTASTKRAVMVTAMEVLGSLMIVFAAAIQLFAKQILPGIQHSWAISLAVIAIGIALLVISRGKTKSAAASLQEK
jgi:hypothetical protein